MAIDLVAAPVSGLRVQMCGDAHLSNFGLFASPERRLLFDLNDFDESMPGPWEWDLKRLARSLVVGQVCGWTLARAHARSGDPIAIAAYIGDDDVLPEAVAQFAELYADQTERDYQAFLEAVRTGRLRAESGL